MLYAACTDDFIAADFYETPPRETILYPACLDAFYHGLRIFWRIWFAGDVLHDFSLTIHVEQAFKMAVVHGFQAQACSSEYGHGMVDNEVYQGV